MAVTAPVPMQTEAFVPLSITYDSKTFVQQDDIWAIQADDADRLALVNKTLPDRDAVYGYLCQIRLLERDLCRALKDANAVEYQPLNKTIFSNNKWNEENFNLLRLETNKFIGELSRYVEKVKALEAMDFIQFENQTFVRRVFDYSWSETRKAEGCLLVWQHAIQERDELIRAHNLAVLLYNKMLESTEALAGVGTKSPTAVKRKAEQKKSQMAANIINKEWFDTNKIADGLVSFRALIDERDELYLSLWELCTFIVMSDSKSAITIGSKPKIRNAAMFGAADASTVHSAVSWFGSTIHGTVGDFDEITLDDDGGVAADYRVTAPVDVDAMSEKALREMVRAQQGTIKKLRSWKENLRSYFPNRKDDGFKLARAIRDMSNFEFHVRDALGGYEDTELYKEIDRLKKCAKDNRDLSEFVSKMKEVIDPKGNPAPDAMIKATREKFMFSNYICSALGCTEDTFGEKLVSLQQEKQLFEIEIGKAFASLETDHKCTTVMEKVGLLSFSMQQIKSAVPCTLIDKVPDMIHDLHQQIEKLKGAPLRTQGLSSSDAAAAKMQEDIDRMTGELRDLNEAHHKLQDKLLEARQDFIREQQLNTENSVKMKHLELICQQATNEIDRVTKKLKRISITNVDPLVLTTRTAYLLGELHKLIDENFARVSEVDIVVLVDRIADVICSAFDEIHKCRAVKALMYTLMVRLQLDFGPRDVDDGVAMARFIITQLKEHGEDIVQNPEKYEKLIEDQLNKLQGVRDASKKRLESMFQAFKDMRSNLSQKHDGESVDESESELEDLQTGGRGHSRSESKPPGKHEGERVDGHKSEFQIRPRGSSGSGRTNMPAAHIECVNNWLRDLSQIV